MHMISIFILVKIFVSLSILIKIYLTYCQALEPNIFLNESTYKQLNY